MPSDRDDLDFDVVSLALSERLDPLCQACLRAIAKLGD
jgi:hypothetical protein